MENIALVTVKLPQSTPAGSGAPNNSNKRSNSASSSTSKMLINPVPELPAMPINQKIKRPDPPPAENITLGVKFLSAGTAACIADMVTFPLDTAKVRLQIQGEASNVSTSATAVRQSPFSSLASQSNRAISTAAAPKGLLPTVASITRNEGVRALYSGLAPGLQRQMCFASVRIGLYDSVKEGYSNYLQVDPSQKNISVRLLAGLTTGATAVLVAQPTDVVKVRMQAQGNKPGQAKRYTGCIQAYRSIAMKEGARGLWKGVIPNMSRNAIVNCTELVSYDLIKESLLTRKLMFDNIPCHFVSAVGAGFFTTLFASPVDVLKTRFMNSAEGAYTGVVDCAVKMYKEAGIRTFYKGAVPAFLRFGPWNVVMFVSYEQLKRHFSKMNSNNNNNNITHTRNVIPALEIKQQQNSSRFM